MLCKMCSLIVQSTAKARGLHNDSLAIKSPPEKIQHYYDKKLKNAESAGLRKDGARKIRHFCAYSYILVLNIHVTSAEASDNQ